MHAILTSKQSRSLIVLLLLNVQFAITGCSFNYTYYTDGPLTQYLKEPIPSVDNPIARTLSLERVTYLTSGGYKGTMIGDLIAREIYVLPEEVGREVDELLNLDDQYSEEATYMALNTIAKNRAKARGIWGKDDGPTFSSTSVSGTSAYTQQSIRNHEIVAKEAYKKGDYLKGDIHTSAAANAMMIDQSFAAAQASVDFAFASLGALKALGENFIKKDFINMRNWIEFKSGAISNMAQEGNHLSVFLLRYVDGKAWQLDGRNRLAVLLVLVDGNGESTSVLEGSDILGCEGVCDLFQPKPTARISLETDQPTDVQQQLWSAQGQQYFLDNGFDQPGGNFQFLLLQHGLQKLSKSLQ